MHQVVELHFDAHTEELLNRARQAFFEQDLVRHAPCGTPHISLSSFTSIDRHRWSYLLDAVPVRQPLEIEFSYIGLFPGKESVIYLGVTPTTQLRDLHIAVHERVDSNAVELQKLYSPDRVVFHTTLGAPVAPENLGRAVELAFPNKLPKLGMVHRLALVEYFPPRILAERELGG